MPGHEASTRNFIKPKQDEIGPGEWVNDQHQSVVFSKIELSLSAFSSYFPPSLGACLPLFTEGVPCIGNLNKMNPDIRFYASCSGSCLLIPRVHKQ